jgi:hypothetical protein
MRNLHITVASCLPDSAPTLFGTQICIIHKEIIISHRLSLSTLCVPCSMTMITIYFSDEEQTACSIPFPDRQQCFVICISGSHYSYMTRGIHLYPRSQRTNESWLTRDRLLVLVLLFCSGHILLSSDYGDVQLVLRDDTTSSDSPFPFESRRTPAKD